MIKTVKSCGYILMVALILLVALTVCTGNTIPVSSTAAANGLDRRNLHEDNSQVRRRADTYRVAGSRLPDCSHACGSCSPCHLVMVHLGCTNSLAETETCPMAYKCFCINKSYPVP